jgi:3-oxoisoapionate decarboxylase
MLAGLSSFTYGWAVGVAGRKPAHPMDEHGLLDRCREHGVKLLQLGDNLPLHTFDDDRLARLAERAGREGVRLEVGARGLTTEHVASYAVIARRVGARLVRFVIDDAGLHPSPDAVVGVLKESAPLLDGLVLGLENHDRFPARTLRRIVESAASGRFGICLDTANSLGAGEGLETLLNELGPLAVNLHVKDFAITRVPHLMGFTVEGRPAGEGMLDLTALLDGLSRFGRCETAVLELWTPPEPQLSDTIAKEASWAARSIGRLRSLIPDPS